MIEFLWFKIPIVLLVSTIIYIFFLFIKKDIVQLGISKQHFYLIELVYILIGLIISYFYLSQFQIINSIFKSLATNTALLVATVGFILQNTIKNIVAGMLISSSQSFKIGDRITIRSKDLTGIVEKITLRHTILRTYTNERVIVPNSTLNEEVLINNDLLESLSGFPLLIPIKDKNQVMKAKVIIEDILRKHPSLENKDIDVRCSDFTDNGKVILKTFVWTVDINESFKETSELRYKIIEAFIENNIDLG